MSGGGILGVGVSALLAAQRGLQVTGHNIANVGTEGYSRQRLELATRPAQYTGVGAIGNGVQPSAVRRVVDEFVELRLGMNLSAEAHQRTLAEFSSQINNLLGDAEAGLAPALDAFFGAVHDLAADPTSTAARQHVIARAEALVDRFGQLEARIQDQRAIASGHVRNTVTEINELAQGIAELNRAIVDARGRAGGKDPNDLLDRRDALVRQLAERVAVSTVEQSDGTLNVYVGSGQSLVVGYQANALSVRTVGGDPDRLAIGFGEGGGFVAVTDYLTGGRLGALLEVRDTIIEPASHALGLIGLSLAESFNAVHSANMDLSGALGEDFFALELPRVLADARNDATGEPAANITDVGALVATDYRLRFDGTDWSVRRLSDGAVIGAVPAGGSLDFDGLSLDLSGVTGAAAGDTFWLDPLRADRLSVRITDPTRVAAALPVRVEPAAANSGGASVHAVAVGDPTNPDLRAPLDIEFTGGEYVVDGQAFALDPSGDTVITINGWDVTLRGAPAEGDVFEVRDNAGGVGDNRGALALASLADRALLGGGTATFNGRYAELVADVGVKTARAQTNAEMQARLLEEAQAQRENVSGVNLDEEAAALLRHQQAYQAAAQVVMTAGNMFDSLLAAFRR